ncbi:MAG: mechanosensitive ion channel family protein, partial [Candidatus Thermoplasmatota archaeon]|nr:mechanosensitive ion channel family protein [Candidatus Thermoplasmatota archaeon]
MRGQARLFAVLVCVSLALAWVPVGHAQEPGANATGNQTGNETVNASADLPFNATDLFDAPETLHANVWVAIGSLLVATTVLLGMLFVLSRAHASLHAYVKQVAWRKLPDLQLGAFRVDGAGVVGKLLERIVDAARTILALALVLIYIPFALSLFETTEVLADRILLLLFQNASSFWRAFTGYVPNLVFILFVATVTWAVLKVLKAGFWEIYRGRITLKGFYPSWGPPTYTLLRFVVLAFLFVIILPKLPGFGTSSFQGISLFIGALVALGASSAMANVMAGVMLTYTRAFSLGDRVKIADTVGDVIERTLLVTRIRTIKNVDVTVPNSQVLSSHVLNYSRSTEDARFILTTEVSIGYDAPWRDVHELLKQAARETEGLLEDPEPFVLQTKLGDFSIVYELNAYTEKPEAMTRLRSNLHQHIQDTFAQAGVEILSPAHRAYRQQDEALPPPPMQAAAP